MIKTKIKICGIHSGKEAKYATEHGADFLGMLVDIPLTNLSISIEKAKTIVKENQQSKFILLSTSQNVKTTLTILEGIKPWGVQLLRPSEELIEGLKKKTKVKIISVIHVTDRRAIKKSLKYSKISDYLLLDTKFGKYLGGTGIPHDWTISEAIIKLSKIPVFLAGGLSNNNVLQAIEKTKPFAVDVESSLRNKRGFRDLKKMSEFIKKIRFSENIF